MPKKQIIGSIIIIIILSFICMYIYDNYKVESTTTLVVDSSTDEKGIKEYYSDKNANYYLYNIGGVEIDFTDRDLELDRALEAKQTTMEEVLGMLTKKVSMNNVNLYQNDDLSILECKLDNNKYNYLFGGPSMEYKEGMCAKDPYICSFNKMYYVIYIGDNKTNDNMFLTIKDDSDTATIQVSKDIAKKLEENKYYTFTFGSTNEEIDDDIKNVFDNNIILKINEVVDPTLEKNITDCK